MYDDSDDAVQVPEMRQRVDGESLGAAETVPELPSIEMGRPIAIRGEENRGVYFIETHDRAFVKIGYSRRSAAEEEIPGFRGLAFRREVRKTPLLKGVLERKGSCSETDSMVRSNAVRQKGPKQIRTDVSLNPLSIEVSMCFSLPVRRMKGVELHQNIFTGGGHNPCRAQEQRPGTNRCF